jgi:hypothetical protein
MLSPTSHSAPPLTIGNAIKAAFPLGTRLFSTGAPNDDERWALAPMFPTDVFAAAALLVENAGIYQSIYPEGHAPAGLSDKYWFSSPKSVVDDLAKKWIEAATTHFSAAAARGRLPSATRQFVSPIQHLWDDLWRSRALNLYESGETPQPWWNSALTLLLVSDAASEGLGFPSAKQNVFNEAPRDAAREEDVPLPTHATFVSPDVACIQPKSRLPRVGCTIRSFSHHLSLLVPRQVAVARWHYLKDSNGKRTSEPLNLLLIPFPYEISARCFRPGADEPRGHDVSSSWGWFELRQRWLTASGDPRDLTGAQGRLRQQSRDSLSQFVAKLVSKAEEDVGEIHGIIFPELALDWHTFSQIFRELTNNRRGSQLEFLISGTSTDENARDGNFVAMLMPNRKPILRSKHHRWKLDGDQIRRYAIGSALDPKRDWWESIYLGNRSIDVVVFREASTLSTLICEDLARIDPCQQLVRAIGPNLVIVLLMDSAQLRARWPARYATVLAEDPGSSVLTLTSFGLVNRANAAGLIEPSGSIALWRDDIGSVQEISLPPSAHAVVITLSGARSPQRTLDGRESLTDTSWRLDGQYPIRVPVDSDMDWIFRAR